RLSCPKVVHGAANCLASKTPVPKSVQGDVEDLFGGYDMARLRLRQSETTRDQLPLVCMVCGQPSVAQFTKNFRWFPKWIGVLILPVPLSYWIMAAVLSKYMTVEVPFCARHRRYFARRSIATAVITVLLFLVPAVLASVILATAENPDERVTGIMTGIFSFVV